LSERAGFAAVLWASCLTTLAVGTNSTAIMAALPNMRPADADRDCQCHHRRSHRRA
jgi:hypothetical protein